jgi:hypothetical protein
MFKIAILLISGMAMCATASAQDGFEAVKCGADIPKALLGRSTSNGGVAAAEGRHRDIQLKNLGGDGISDYLFLESWSICGTEFELLVNSKARRIRDVLAFPAHSRRSPMTLGPCEVKGTRIAEAVIAVLDNSKGYNPKDSAQAKTMLAATAAWKIDEGKEQFVALPLQGLSCSLEGVITSDGGP